MTPSITTMAMAMAMAFGVGAAVGALYFLLLWLAVRVLIHRPRPLPFHMVVFYVQILVRIGLVCAGLLLAVILEAPVEEIVLAVAGFIAARFVITDLVRRQGREGV